MFLVNSCLGLFTASHFRDHPFSLSYGVILPSSLTIVLSITLGFSPRPPVSVSGTGTYMINPRSFSWKLGFTILRLHRSALFVITLQYISITVFPMYLSLRLNQNPFTGYCYPSPSLLQSYRRYGTFYPLSIDYALQPRLRS